LEGRRFSIAIVGAGASGLVAAISAKHKGASVVICEKMPRPGKKILASGNGRCNLANDNLAASFYNSAARPLVDSVLSRFGKDAIIRFFEGLGLKTYSQEGRVFPATNQSSSVLKVLESELKRLSIPVEFEFDCAGITAPSDGFVLTSKSNKKISADSVILACGGKSYPAFGADGSAYALAKKFGHSIVEPVPVGVPIIAKDELCHSLQGQKISASAQCMIDGKAASKAEGELLFTKYGLSGTAILDISEDVSIAFNREGKRNITVSVDMVPFMEEEELSDELARRLGGMFSAEDALAGILPNKFGPALKNILKSKDPRAIAGALKHRLFKVLGTRGWNEAEFTAGGVSTKEVDDKTLESKLKKGLYFAGEILDVNGRRGGYNLAWAWASGHVAGEAATHA